MSTIGTEPGGPVFQVRGLTKVYDMGEVSAPVIEVRRTA